MDRLSAVTSYAASWVPQGVSNALSSLKPFAESLFARMRENSPSAGLVAKRFAYGVAYKFAAVVLVALAVLYYRFKAKQTSQSNPELVYQPNRTLEFSALGFPEGLKEMTRDIINQMNSSERTINLKAKATGQLVNLRHVSLEISQYYEGDARIVLKVLHKKEYFLGHHNKQLKDLIYYHGSHIEFKD